MSFYEIINVLPKQFNNAAFIFMNQMEVSV